jgi:hypothetical protein
MGDRGPGRRAPGLVERRSRIGLTGCRRPGARCRWRRSPGRNDRNWSAPESPAFGPPPALTPLAVCLSMFVMQAATAWGFSIGPKPAAVPGKAISAPTPIAKTIFHGPHLSVGLPWPPRSSEPSQRDLAIHSEPARESQGTEFGGPMLTRPLATTRVGRGSGHPYCVADDGHDVRQRHRRAPALRGSQAVSRGTPGRAAALRRGRRTRPSLAVLPGMNGKQPSARR